MKTIVISTGDPAGCGPLITLDAISAQSKNTRFLVVGDKAILGRIPLYKKVRSRFTLIDAATPGIDSISPGFVTRESGKAALKYVDIALDIMRAKKLTRLVTAPLSKEAVQLTHKNFCGHTEYLANRYKIKSFEMMMVSDKLKVVLLTRHIPLNRVSSQINAQGFARSIDLVYTALRDLFRIRSPKLALTSINPHAGLATYLDKEEREMAKAIAQSGRAVTGPLPADSIFTPDQLKKFDCVLCAYHDQGMIPFKLLSFAHGVNLTIGLPVIRTSPSHGVALDIIRRNRQPFSTSMTAAIELARQLSL